MSKFREYRHRARVWWDVPPHAATTAFVSLILLTAAGFFYIQYQDHQQRIEFCKDSIKPDGVRGIVAAQIEQNIAQSKAISPKFFPSIPPDEFKRLIAESTARQEDQIHDLLDIDCEAL